MGKHRKIQIGDKFDSLEIIGDLGYRKYGGKDIHYWKCKCLKCGNTIDVPQKNISVVQKDCGCGKGAAYPHDRARVR